MLKGKCPHFLRASLHRSREKSMRQIPAHRRRPHPFSQSRAILPQKNLTVRPTQISIWSKHRNTCFIASANLGHIFALIQIFRFDVHLTETLQAFFSDCAGIAQFPNTSGFTEGSLGHYNNYIFFVFGSTSRNPGID
jgi:hypothetical protein